MYIQVLRFCCKLRLGSTRWYVAQTLTCTLPHSMQLLAALTWHMQNLMYCVFKVLKPSTAACAIGLNGCRSIKKILPGNALWSVISEKYRWVHIPIMFVCCPPMGEIGNETATSMALQKCRL